MSPKLIPAILLAIAALRGETICGHRVDPPSGPLAHVSVACVDYEKLRAVAPAVAWPKGAVTQVLIHARDGRAVRVEVDGEVIFADLARDAEGRLVALVQVPGIEHRALSVAVLLAVPE